jgi:hypothetical protein
VSRAELVVEMSSEALMILRAKIAQIEKALSEHAVLSQSISANNDKNDSKTALLIDNSQSEIGRICRPVAEVVEMNETFSAMSVMLLQMDAVCSASLRTFQSLLPEVQTRTTAQRRVILIDILTRYSHLYLTDEPTVVTCSTHGNSDKITPKKSGAKNKDVSHTGIEREDKPDGWIRYSKWYSERKAAMLEIEKEFGGFVEDEREKEGRLLKKWLSLSDPILAPASSSSSSTLRLPAARQTPSSSNIDNSSSSNYTSNSSSDNNNSSSSSSSNNINGKNNHDNKITTQRPRRSSTALTDISTSTSPPSTFTTHTTHINTHIEGGTSTSEKLVSTSSSSRVRASSDSVIDTVTTTDRSNGNGTYKNCTVQDESRVKRSHMIPSDGTSLRQQSVRRLTSDTVPYSATLSGQLHSPRCVTAFMEYFCSYYIAAPYGIHGIKGAEELLEALKAIVEVPCPVYSIKYLVLFLSWADEEIIKIMIGLRIYCSSDLHSTFHIYIEYFSPY